MEKCDKCNGVGVIGLEPIKCVQQTVAIGPQELDAIGPTAPTGSTAFIFEIAALKAERDRLRRELEEAKAELALMRPVVEAALREDWLAMVSALAAYVAGAGKEGE